MDKCYENRDAIIEHDQEHGVLTLIWKKFTKEEKFRQVLNEFYDLSTAKEIVKWCIDSRKQNLVASDDQKWMIDEMIKREFHLKTIKTALIIPENVFMQLSIDRMTDDLAKNADSIISEDGNTRQFANMEQAFGWLKQVEV